MADKFQRHGLSRNGPGLGPVDFALSDSVDLVTPLRQLVILAAGDVRFTGSNGVTVTKSYPAGFTLDCQITRVHVTGTTVPIANLLGIE